MYISIDHDHERTVIDDFRGNYVLVSENSEDDIGPVDVVVTITHEGVIIDIVDLISGDLDVIETSSETWDEIVSRLSNR